MEFRQVPSRNLTISLPAVVQEPVHDLTQPPDGHFMMNKEKGEDFFKVLSSIYKMKGNKRKLIWEQKAAGPSNETETKLSCHNSRSPPGSSLCMSSFNRSYLETRAAGSSHTSCRATWSHSAAAAALQRRSFAAPCSPGEQRSSLRRCRWDRRGTLCLCQPYLKETFYLDEGWQPLDSDVMFTVISCVKVLKWGQVQIKSCCHVNKVSVNNVKAPAATTVGGGSVHVYS